MTSKEKKEILLQYRQLDNSINDLIEQQARLRALAMRTTPVISDKQPIQKGNGNNKVESIVEKIVLLEEEINKKIDKLIDLKKIILNAIEKLKDLRLRRVMILKYIKGNTFEEIAVEMNYCYKQICRLHGQALQLIQL